MVKFYKMAWLNHWMYHKCIFHQAHALHIFIKVLNEQKV